jgi:hypothetical protein
MNEDRPDRVRPRSTAEVLDDGWEIVLADGPALLALNLPFQAAAFACLLWLLGRPAPEGLDAWLWPLVCAVLLPLTGLGSGACQERLCRRAEGRPGSLLVCWLAALAQAPGHVAARAVILAGVLVSPLVLLMPGLALWISGTTAHAALAAGRGGIWAGLGEASRAAAVEPARAGVVTMMRLPMLGVACGNLHLLLLAGLWVCTDLAGLDLAFAGRQLALDNPVYLAALILLAWMLLSPCFEAANFLLYADSRARREGLDLLLRVERVFRAVLPLVLVLLGGLLLAGQARADEEEPPPRLSRETIKGFLRKHAAPGSRPGTQKRPAPKNPEAERKEPPVEEDAPARKVRRSTSGPAVPASGAGLGALGWAVLAGLALAVVALAVARWRSARRGAPVPKRIPTAQAPVPEKSDPLPHEQPAAVWWRHAEALARAGKFAEGMRALYHAVLAQLHQAGLIRCDPTRTNGEYVEQIRRAGERVAGEADFAELTARFEAGWYGGQTCTRADYQDCRGLAERLRDSAPA